MKNNLLFLAAIVCLNTGILTAQTTVNVSSGGGLKVAVKAVQPDLSLVTNLTVTGQIDARDFRFIRDSLNATLLSLDLSGTTIVAYSGTGGPAYVANGGDANASYGSDTIPQNAFYHRAQTGPIFFPVITDRGMTVLTSLVLPVSAKYIGENAFRKMEALLSLNLSGLTQCTGIGNQVFLGMSSAQTIVLPPNVASIGSAPFARCTSLTAITIPNSVSSLANVAGFFEGCTSLASVVFDEPCQITTLPYRMFYSDLTMEELQLGALTTVTVPSSVTDVSTAFEIFLGTAIECHPANARYESIDGVLYLKGSGAIVTVPKGITSFTIPSTMTEIPNDLFRNCINLTSVTVLSNLTKIGSYAFYNCPISSFTFPSTLQEIGQYAFAATKLTSVSFTNNAALTTIGNNVFSNNGHLKTANLTGLAQLGLRMFLVCDSLTTITLKSDLATISASAFEGCKSLVSINIPNTVTSIGTNAFGSCYKLTGVNLPDALVSLGAGVFQNDSLITAFHIPQSFTTLTNSNGHAFTSTFGNITVDAANPNFAAENGMLLNKTKNRLYHIPASATVKSIAVPATVDTIATYAFYLNNNRNIKKITLPAGLKRIESYGLYAADKLDTLITKAVVPPVCANASSSLNNLYTTERPVVIVPPKTLTAYKAANGWQNYYGADFDAFVAANWFYAMDLGIAEAVSPNGNYVAGKGSSAWLWDYNAGTTATIPEGLSVADINDAGMITGTFADNNYIVAGQPIENGGVYRNRQWYSLGLGRYGSTTTTAEAMAMPGAITAGGDVYGMSYTQGSLARIVPFIWKYNTTADNYTTDTLTWASPSVTGDQGARFQDVSSDGTVASGWVSRSIYGGARRAIVWTSPANYIMIDEDNNNEAKGVSPGGKYIATSKEGKAAIYDVVNNITRVFGVPGSSASAVSDNGFVVGFAQRGDNFESGRRAFIWSDKLGFMYFDQFLARYCPDIVLPNDPIYSFAPAEARFDVPMSISADGLVICGWSGYGATSQKGWILCLADALDLIDRPKNLTAEVPVADRNKVVLNWDAPTEYGTHGLDFYYIYRDGVYINRVEAWEGTSYTDLNVSAGAHTYNVSAVFDYASVPTVTYLESGQADYVAVSIVDNYNIPFHEDFEAGLEKNYWMSNFTAVSGWGVFNQTGFTENMSAIFMTDGNRQPYNHALTSKPFDATGQTKVVLSYVYSINTIAGSEWLGRKDTVKVEVSNKAGTDAVWNTLQTYIIDAAKPWTPATLDISPFAAGHLFRVRFHCVSGDNRNLFNFDVDNFGLALETNDIAPTGVKAYRFEGDTIEHVVYKDRTGAYGLTHTRGQITQAIGNEGVPFIAAQKFDANDLKPYQDKYLTSISAYINADMPDSIPTQLKLAVWVNGARVESGNISSFEGGAWNTFELATPILLTGSQTIIAGIEVAQHRYYGLPLAMDNTDSIHVNTKGNLLSYNNGATWTDPNVAERFQGMWAITANVRDEFSAQSIDKDEFEIAYQIIRDNAVVATLYRGQHYTETAIAKACYTVKSFRIFGGLSPESASACEEVLVPSGLNNPAIDKLVVYPNPAHTFVNISQAVEYVKIYNAVGQLVLQTKVSQINVSNFAKGVYIFDAILQNGNRAVARVIVE
ncbi:hypothetical protein FACS189429_4230 [Bacteroidia bacterium]|nr:hypothetical protein FACS189429_4230 [Bacteroidia bacterium]GHV43167.1 hypothetical protein FACS1894180_1470 [Bacteroidia bacterium]